MRSIKHPAPDWLTARPIAHRGLHNVEAGAAENSLAAFERAKKAELPIEFDVHLSSDHIPIVFHDETLVRMTGDPRQISDVTAQELMALPLTGGTDLIPDLQAVLDLAAGDVPLVIELKQCPFGRETLCRKVWERLKDYQGPYSVQSFDPLTLKWFRINAPHVTRGQLAMKSPPRKMPLHRKFLMRHMLLNSVSQPHYIGYSVSDISLWTVRRVMKPNRPLLAWTVSNEEELRHARRYADNVIFEDLPVELVIPKSP